MGSLREALLTRGLVSTADLDALEDWAPYRGLSFAEKVFRSGLVGDGHLVEAFVALGATDGTAEVLQHLPPPAALGALTKALAEKHRALPMRVEGRRLLVALLDPSDTTTLEKLSFYCGLIVEPRAGRARVLFEALARAYGVAVVRPDGAFLEARRHARSADDGDVDEDLDEDLPGPAGQRRRRPLPSAEPGRSPLASAVAMALAERDGEAFVLPEPPLSLLEMPARDLRPARSPSILSDASLRTLRSLRTSDVLSARDSLPPQVLSLLVPPLRSAVLFLRRDTVAVGWDGRAPNVGREQIRDVLVPLTAPSVLADAAERGEAVLGNPRDPTTMERTIFRFLHLPPPRAYAALPLVVGNNVVALLYIDRSDGLIDDGLLEDARRVGTALADGLAPFVECGVLFPDERLQN